MSEIPDKLFYKGGEICKYTDTQPYVLRFWESEFPQLTRTRNQGGQRVYSREDLDLVLKIKKLLYDSEYTIAGVRELLEREEASAPAVAPAPVTPEERLESLPVAPVASPREAGALTEHADSYKASYELARQEIESLRQRLADSEERCRDAEHTRDQARERCERVAARLESLLSSSATQSKSRRAR